MYWLGCSARSCPVPCRDLAVPGLEISIGAVALVIRLVHEFVQQAAVPRILHDVLVPGHAVLGRQLAHAHHAAVLDGRQALVDLCVRRGVPIVEGVLEEERAYQREVRGFHRLLNLGHRVDIVRQVPGQRVVRAEQVGGTPLQSCSPGSSGTVPNGGAAVGFAFGLAPGRAQEETPIVMAAKSISTTPLGSPCDTVPRT
jgi:hypothetical protein